MNTATALAPEPVKSNHRVNVVRIKEVKIHPNADKLEIYPIDGTDYQYIGTKGQFKIGDLAAYIQPDSVVPDEPQYSFLWEGRVFEGPVSERYRRIRAKKLRKEWSEGLLIPILGLIPNVEEGETADRFFEEGEDIAEMLGITHYDPEPAAIPSDCEKGPRRNKRYPGSLKGWFYFLLRKATFNYFDKFNTGDSGREAGPQDGFPVYDVEAYKNYKGAIYPDEMVVVTEKIHGSNFRAVFFDGKFYVGSRKLWKKESSGCVWRRAAKQNPWIEQWCRKFPGSVVYGEVTPTQAGYNYGATTENPKVFMFAVLSAEGKWVSWEDMNSPLLKDAFEPLLNNWVPVLEERFFHENTIKTLADGLSVVLGAKHRREGIVITPMRERQVKHLGRVQLKMVSNSFLEKDE